jgi:hypothetical protein
MCDCNNRSTALWVVIALIGLMACCSNHNARLESLESRRCAPVATK